MLEDKVAMFFLINQVLCSAKLVAEWEAGIAIFSGKRSESGSVYPEISDYRGKAATGETGLCLREGSEEGPGVWAERYLGSSLHRPRRMENDSQKGVPLEKK